MLDRRLLYAAQRISLMHLGPYGSMKEVHGTCFFVKSDAELYAVTNRHNLDLAFKDPKWVGYKLENFKIAGFADNDHYYETAPTEPIRFVFPTNQFEDVAALDLTNKQMQFCRKRRQGEDPNVILGAPSVFAIEASMLANTDDLKRMTAGAPIFMPSYSLHYDRSSERPVMRGGIVSSDPDSDYLTDGQEPARRVLYQAQSAEGASGAPVFALMGTEGVLLGVNAGHLVLPSKVPSGFSYCFKAECIRECIEELRRHGSSAIVPDSADRLSERLG